MIHCKCGTRPEIRPFHAGRMTLYYVRCPNCHRTGRKSLTEYQAEKKWNEEGVKHGGN